MEFEFYLGGHLFRMKAEVFGEFLREWKMQKTGKITEKLNKPVRGKKREGKDR